MAYPIFPCSRYSYSSRDSHHRLRARSHFRAGLLHEADGLPRWEALRRAALTIAPPEAADSDGVGQDSEHEAAKPDAPSSPPPNDGPPTQAALGGMSAHNPCWSVLMNGRPGSLSSPTMTLPIRPRVGTCPGEWWLK